MNWLIRQIDRVTMCRWKGHDPWLGFCERCGKTLEEREVQVVPRGL